MTQNPCPAMARPLVIPEIVSFPAELDIVNSARVAAGLIAALQPGTDVVIADLTRTEFCDSSGVRCLIAAYDYALARGIDLRIVVVSEVVRRALHILGADQVLPLYRSLKDALSNRPPGTRQQHENPGRTAAG